MRNNNIIYNNWWSKLLFKKAFEEQFFIPPPPSIVDKTILAAIEKWKFSQDFSFIKIKKPIFIVGLPRSGTTMLYDLLCVHQNAAYITNSINAFPEEICAIEWLRKKLSLNISGERFFKDSIEVDFGSPSEPHMMWGKWFGRDVDSLFWDEKRIKDLSETKVLEIKNDIKKILFCFGGEEKRFICKYPVIQTELKIVQDLFPDAHFIHIVRDGRQVANSLIKLHKMANEQIKRIKHPTVKYIVPYPRVKKLQEYVEHYGAESVECTARVWEDAISLVEETKKELSHFMEVRYEDILKNPQIEMEKIFAFSDLEWPGPLNQHFAKKYQEIGKIHHANSYGEFALIEKIAHKTLLKYNYISPTT
ncbi:MAG: hypothetical protein A2504_08015 [Bdellovibrionales bacterium RIFOXYD12_FULL_39_22]|nr:MAG: hypothetical protein A2385_13640 [Bdellovibrionales bacterium RIFOXYB1_FULL_39_21]OFZ44876.1 MAG: hypothetical protein A2485_14850 [Bdellovibrionales bacterium RIFOXYC12_FULL_39_17]OFZ49394.1 MAG: hypothetical protein A2404_09185 [Bdellovibrionales bacterium RIFOXYC1_FULL_39_130]OFZ74087.1 MAG: hypothetical protein A2451_05850 [Bdellovibrionales bacterium RIFOXYC2_FULL_39_8]OFZ77115.1 MAG: hypothetical protein A2560_10835 [Bdellovibrionales bacterium RIFOXYD1_FULL_39_84]OFZ95576.1 MAG: